MISPHSSERYSPSKPLYTDLASECTGLCCVSRYGQQCRLFDTCRQWIEDRR